MYVHIYNKEKVNLYINPRNFFQVRKWGFIVQVRFILFSERFPYCGFIRDEHARADLALNSGKFSAKQIQV